MSIALQGTVKAPGDAGSSTIVFDSTPAEGDLIVLLAATGSDTPTFPSGFSTYDASWTTSPYVFISSKIAGASETNSYTVSNLGSGTGQGAGGMCFRATSGFKTTPEQAGSTGANATSLTIDPAGVPSEASSVAVAVFRDQNATVPSSTNTWNGGSAVTPTAIDRRNFFDYIIMSSAPADFKATGTSGRSAQNLGMAIVAYVESDTPPVREIDVVENISVAEAVTVSGDKYPSVSESSITVSETIQYYSDLICLNEYVTVELSAPAASTNSNFFMMFD